MPEKEESYITENDNVVCSPDYQDLTLSRETLHSDNKKGIPLPSQMEENSVPTCHTAFPVDLKEVFELTNPNAEIHQAILRPPNEMSAVPMQYSHTSQMLHSPKETQEDSNESEVTWRHVLRDSSHSDEMSERTQLLHSMKDHSAEERRAWDTVIDEPQNLSEEAMSGNEMLHPPKSSQIAVISNPEAWSHVIKQTSDSDKQHIHSTTKNRSQMLSSSDHGSWNHVLEEMPTPREIPHSSQIIHSHSESAQLIDGHKQWNHLINDPARHQEVANVPPMDLSGDCTKLTDLIPDRRDVSCQVDDIPCHTSLNDNHHSPQDATGQKVKCSDSQNKHIAVTTSLEDVPQSMLNLTIVTEAPSSSPQVVVHNGIKPELYTQERHLVVQAGTKAQVTTKTSSTYPCNHCGKVFGDSRSLQRHMLIHIGLRPYRCPVCGKAFMLNGVKPHSCKYCGRQFALKGNLTQHVRTHVRTQSKGNESSNNSFNNKSQAEPQLICDLSYSHTQKTFVSVPNSASSLKLPHIITSNQSTSLTSSHPYVQTSSPSDSNHQSPSVGLSFCSECSKTFPSPESLHEHVQLIHEQSTRLASNRYLCNICQKEFCLKGDLTRHLNSHNGVKPYECEHCNKTFTLKSNLRQHLTTHRMDKNFACPMCSKSFGNRRNLNLHLRRHEQARANFTCTKCGRSFLAKSDHFFHDCVKNETSSSSLENPHTPLSTNAVINGNTPPDSPEEAINTTPLTIQTDVELPNQTVPLSTLPVKRETCHLPCDDRELADPLECNTSGLTSVNGAQSFLGPFYRHLYFSTSHQSMIPTLKGLLHASNGETNVAEFNRAAKTN
ncbi:zinc finger protein 418 [Nephila pilipes]|uniref:Zinc finger protein 418 n=1 Tax=Nephila pilipes TaxID=299642 RepID=A0A8X6NRS8_NEPPI|nr:zinc finger protein 418 [Nephila pilipes]